MAVVEPITVLLNGKVAGTLNTDGVSQAEFAYADGYLDDRAAVPLSMSLPFQTESFRSTATRRWVEGLLPDNHEVLLRWCSNEGVSPPTPLGLISTRVGHDCAGAVQFCREGDEEMLLGRRGDVRVLPKEELVREVALMAQDTARWLPDDETLQRAEELASTIIDAAQAQIDSLPRPLPGMDAVDAFRSKISQRATDCLRAIASTRNRLDHRR